MVNTLLIIDPQNDFCHPDGSLYVPGAEHDCHRLSRMIERLDGEFSSIHVTMDTHHLYHIAHPIYWMDREGKHPDPFTLITPELVTSGDYVASVQQQRKYAHDYVQTLSRTGKYDLCIWPPHCLIGSWGHEVFGPLSDALIKWEANVPGRVVDYTYKGSNLRTEHYSAIRAEVSDPTDPGTKTNFSLIERLKTADNIVIAGEALSHCVANTTRDLLTCIPAEKLVVLEDVSSNVVGFESYGSIFLREIENIGVRLITSDELLS